MQLYGNSGAIWITEDNCFAKGGEGELYNIVGFNDYVAKIYKEGLLTATRQEKLIYMSSLYSGDRMQQLAWPKDILKDPHGNVKGFVMRRFSATKDLADLLDGTSNNSSNNLDWLKRIVIALNLAHLVNEIHLMDQVIGDMNPKNFGVDMGNGFACAFDTDSFHLRNKSTGKWYPCTVLDEHYIAPEFQARLNQGGRVDSFRPEETFTRETDNFALAVLIFQLLFNGVHPFTAARVPSRGSSVVIHTRETNIYQRMSPFFNPAPNTTIPVYAPPLSIIPLSMQGMFKKAFLQNTRPTAQQWAAELSSLLLKTDKCPKGHYFGTYNTRCPWCGMEEKKKQASVAAASSPASPASSSSAAAAPAASSASAKPAVKQSQPSPSVPHAPAPSNPSTPAKPTVKQPQPSPSVSHTPASNSPSAPAKKNNGWKILIPIIAVLLMIIISSGNKNNNSNLSRTGNSSNYTQASKQTNPTKRPITSQTAKPTATPVPRTFSFDSFFKASDGVVTISWTDSKHESPYNVYYTYIDESSPVRFPQTYLGQTYSTSIDCPSFIPGSQYDILVVSADGQSARTTFTYHSASTFADGKLQASSIKLSVSSRSISSANLKNGNWESAESCKFSAKKMESDLKSDKNHYGIHIEISFPQLAYSRTYQTLFAFFAPNGFTYSSSASVTYDSGYTYYWDCYGTNFFDELYANCGKIPTGKYTVKLFFNGQFVNSQKFTVNK